MATSPFWQPIRFAFECYKHLRCFLFCRRFFRLLLGDFVQLRELLMLLLLEGDNLPATLGTESRMCKPICVSNHIESMPHGWVLQCHICCQSKQVLAQHLPQQNHHFGVPTSSRHFARNCTFISSIFSRRLEDGCWLSCSNSAIFRCMASMAAFFSDFFICWYFSLRACCACRCTRTQLDRSLCEWQI